MEPCLAPCRETRKPARHDSRLFCTQMGSNPLHNGEFQGSCGNITSYVKRRPLRTINSFEALTHLGSPRNWPKNEILAMLRTFSRRAKRLLAYCFSPFSLQSLKDFREDMPTTRNDTFGFARRFSMYTRSSHVELLEFGDIRLDLEILSFFSDGVNSNSCWVRFVRFQNAQCIDLSPLCVVESFRGVTKIQIVEACTVRHFRRKQCTIPRSQAHRARLDRCQSEANSKVPHSLRYSTVLGRLCASLILSYSELPR